MTAFAEIGDDGRAGAPKQAEQLVAGHRAEYTLLFSSVSTVLKQK
jgi:hypothetical protein